tara:strand:- start:823 stop:3126 length:2304 start_codon:yes stop_codon:yes gene_type:complete
MNTNVQFVTSMNESGFNRYGKNMMDSAIKYWQPSILLTIFYHDFDLPAAFGDVPDNIILRDLNECGDMLAYRERQAKFDGTMGGQTDYNWRMDSIKWCHKVYAMTDLAFELADQSIDAGWLCWLDADTITNRRFTMKDIKKIINKNAEFVHLGRTDVDYSETSYMAFNLSTTPPLEMLGDLRGCYDIGEVLAYREWHDGFIIERLLNIYTAHGMRVQNLTPKCKGLTAFQQSPLSQYMTHFKGALKDKPKPKLYDDKTSPDITGPKRYHQLAEVVRHYNRKSVVEVGTWNGGRAIEMALAAFEKLDKFTYNGFDLFEEATNESDDHEMNSKAHNSLKAVTKRLTEFQAKMKEKGKDFQFKLTKGDTNKTLKGFDTGKVDLAYIDGGHSFDTCLSDYKNLKDINIIVFDDYFSKDNNDKIPIEEHCGTNQVITDHIEDGWHTIILPSDDPVLGGGLTHLAITIHKDMQDLPVSLRRVPIVVTPKDCVPQDYIVDNINANAKLITDNNWVRKCSIHGDVAILISAGPSIDWDLVKDTIKMNPNSKVVTVKHSYPQCLENGINPDYCIILDPRPITGISTHGIKRKKLFKEVRKDTTFLLASMTDPSVTKYLLKKGAKIRGWHAYSDAVRDMQKGSDDNVFMKDAVAIPEGVVLVTGGTCAAMRAFGMFHVLGFRNFEMFGFDCSTNITPTEEELDIVEDTGHPKYIKVEAHGENFYTTGELLAMAQDMEKLWERDEIDANITFHGLNTLGSAVFNNSKKIKELKYQEIL